MNSDTMTWDELQNTNISKPRDLPEDHKSYTPQAPSRSSDRPSICETIILISKIDINLLFDGILNYINEAKITNSYLLCSTANPHQVIDQVE